MIKFQQSQALTSHFESFWSIVISVESLGIFLQHRFYVKPILGILEVQNLPF